MKAEQIQEIIEEIQFLSRKRSQSYVAAKAQVSTAVISKLANHNLENISDAMLNKIQANLKIDPNWKIAVTDNLEEVYNHCHNAQQLSMHLCISDHAGRGKTNGYEYYDRKNENVFHVECKKSWSKKVFVQQLLIAVGKKPQGTTWEMIEEFDNSIRNTDKALLILDQADHLKEPNFNMIMDFINDHGGRLGVIISGVKHLERKMRFGVQRNKGSYDELDSRLGRRYIELDPISVEDVTKICMENGLTDATQIQVIYDTAITAGGGIDLRRVKRSVQASKLKQVPFVKLTA